MVTNQINMNAYHQWLPWLHLYHDSSIWLEEEEACLGKIASLCWQQHYQSGLCSVLINWNFWIKNKINIQANLSKQRYIIVFISRCLILNSEHIFISLVCFPFTVNTHIFLFEMCVRSHAQTIKLVLRKDTTVSVQSIWEQKTLERILLSWCR